MIPAFNRKCDALACFCYLQMWDQIENQLFLFEINRLMKRRIYSFLQSHRDFYGFIQESIANA